MPEPNFDIDRLGMLTLQHFEHGVESDSSCGENVYSNSELSSNASSPTYFTEESESPVSSPTELKPSISGDRFWESNAGKVFGDRSEDIKHKENRHEQPTCRYRRGRRSKETVSKRNERERRRVRLISDGFCELRKRLKIQPCNRKLPKLQILRRAILYIKNLQDMIRESDLQNASVGHGLAVCPTTPSQIQMAYLYDPPQLQNIPTTYVDTPTLKRHNIHQLGPQTENPWLQGYKL